MSIEPKSTAVTEKPASAKRTFQQLIDTDQFKGQLMAALPKHLTPDRFIRTLMTATIKSPLLLQCMQESMFKGIFDCAAAGLELDGRRAHLIPFKNNQKQCYEAQLILDYKGIAELIMRSGVVSTIHADVVCDKDVFEVDRGQVVKHVIDFKGDRGAAYAYYCRIVMKDGGDKCEVMSKRDVDKIRGRSRAGQSGPWVTDYDEMAKKTVFRRASKWVPLSPEIRNVVESDDEPIDVVTTAVSTNIAALIGAPTDEQVKAAAGESTPATAEETKAAPPDDKVARGALLGELEGICLDLGWSEKAVLAMAPEDGPTKPAKMGDLTLKQLTSLVALAKREYAAKK